jgi:hypothetical protein
MLGQTMQINSRIQDKPAVAVALSQVVLPLKNLNFFLFPVMRKNYFSSLLYQLFLGKNKK